MHTRHVAKTTITWLWRRRQVLRAIVPACALLLAVTPARAQKEDPREIQARTDCLAGRYQAGVDLLAQMFAETSNATYIYNQGRCYEQNGKFEEAILHFREFLRKARDLSAEDRAEANSHIAECRAELDKHTVVPPPKLEPRVGDNARATSGGVVSTTQERPAGDGNGLRVAGIVTASIGVAGLITGAILSVETHHIQDQVSADDAQRKYDRSKDDLGKLLGKMQWVGYGVGAAVLATGGLLYYLGYQAPHSPSSGSVSLLPALLPGGGGAFVQGSF